MKKLILLLIFVASFSCKAQQTYPMSLDYLDYLDNNNHIKDTNGDLNKFVGTWKWIHPTNSNTYFEIIFIKVEDWNPNNFDNFFIDNNIGASLFESNSTFTTFDKVTHNKTTDNVDKQPCN